MTGGRRFPVCCYCGACAGFGIDFKKYKDKEAVFDKGCGGTTSKGFCFSFCPNSFAVCRLCEGDCPRLSYGVCDFSPRVMRQGERILGFYKKIISVQSKIESVKERGQNGGAVTGLLSEPLESGYIDAVVAAKRTENWKAEPFIATTPEDILLASGSKYTACPSILGLWQAIDAGYKKIAVVGTPCIIFAVRKLQALHDNSLELDRVRILVGLFCTEAFWHNELVKFLLKRKIDIKKVQRFDISEGKLIVIASGREFSIPLKKMEYCVRDTCRVCPDFSSELADISAGSIGSPKKWTTLLIRTKRGEEFMETAGQELYTKKLDPQGIKEIEKAAWQKKNKNFRSIMNQIDICSACLTNPFPFALRNK